MSTDRRTILIASDHNGNEARDHLVSFITSQGHSVVDMGPRTDERILGVRKVDYVDYAQQVAYAIMKNTGLLGILICGTGIGMSVAANRFKNVRASLVHDVHTAKKTREHNDSNVLVLGSWKSTKSEMEEIVSTWLSEPYAKGRHERRVNRIDPADPESIVLVPGVFELVHGGHIGLLNFARSLGRVVVALNSDSSAENVKGRKMKVKFDDRKRLLEHLDVVDEVVELSGNDAGDLIQEIAPNYVVKGGQPDAEDEVRAIDKIPGDVGVKIFPLDHSHSSRELREKFSG